MTTLIGLHIFRPGPDGFCGWCGTDGVDGHIMVNQDEHDIEILSNEAAFEADQRWREFIESRKTRVVGPRTEEEEREHRLMQEDREFGWVNGS